MKKYLRFFSLLFIAFLAVNFASGQTSLVPDQNPNYEISRDKYMKVADSINEWHSTTPQDTYKAIDFMTDRQQARADRRQFRRELRLERARYGYNYGYNYYPSYGTYYYPRTDFSYYGNHYRRQHSFNYWWGLNFRYP